MNTYIIINKTRPVRLDFELTAENYDLGNSWQDYLDGKWVELSAEQVAFWGDNPNASVKNIWDMELPPAPPEPDLLQQAKDGKLMQITQYDAGDNVNSFTIAEQSLWLNPEERTNYKSTLQDMIEAGIENVPFMGVTMPCAMALAAIKAINIYAMQCVGVTNAHKAAVNALTTVAEVEDYDYTSGYPDKLIFTL